MTRISPRAIPVALGAGLIAARLVGPWPPADAHASDAGADGPGQAPPPQQLFLASFPLENHLSGSLFDRGQRVRVTLQFDAARAGARNEITRRLRLSIGADGRLSFPVGGYPRAGERPLAQHRRPSFLIDFDEPAFQPALAEARSRLGTSPTVEDLVRFVDRYITRKGWGRGFDIASVVARRREGDCTEHAVLLAALARAFGFSARVVEGLVLIEVRGAPAVAFGHAWVEVYRDKLWQPADAALPTPEPRIYIPLEVIGIEGASFGLSITETAAGTVGVRRVTIDRGQGGGI